MKREKKNPLRLPDRLVFTAIQIAVAGSLACSGESKLAPDASSDVDIADSTTDATDATATDTATADSLTGDTASADTSQGDVVADDSSQDGPSPDACAVPYFCLGMVPDASGPGQVCDLSQCPLDAGCAVA